MTEQELENKLEQLALQRICPNTMKATTIYEINAVRGLVAFAHQVHALYKREDERTLNREAAYDDVRLRDEVKYWKDKSYKLGQPANGEEKMEESRLKEMTTKELERLKIQHDAAQDFGRKWRECHLVL